MFSACGNGHSGFAKLLLENDAHFDLNSKDKWGRTAFHMACEHGHVNVAKMLIDDAVLLGIDLDVKDIRGENRFL